MTAEIRMSGSERKKQIIDAAIAVFSQKGYKGTTIKDIAHKAGVSDATLFKHFPDKKEMYETIIKECIASVHSPFREMGHDLEFSLILKNAARMIINHTKKDSTLQRMMLYMSLEEPQSIGSLHETKFYEDIKFIAEKIEQGIKHNEYRNIHPRIAAHAFICMIAGYCITQYIMRQDQNEDFDVDEVAEHFVTIFLNGIKKR